MVLLSSALPLEIHQRANVNTCFLWDEHRIRHCVQCSNDRFRRSDFEGFELITLEDDVDEVSRHDLLSQQQVGDQRLRASHFGTLRSPLETDVREKRLSDWEVLNTSTIRTPSAIITLSMLELQEGFGLVTEDDPDITLLATLNEFHCENRLTELALEFLAYENIVTEQLLSCIARAGDHRVLAANGFHDDRLQHPPQWILEECMDPFLRTHENGFKLLPILTCGSETHTNYTMTSLRIVAEDLLASVRGPTYESEIARITREVNEQMTTVNANIERLEAEIEVAEFRILSEDDLRDDDGEEVVFPLQ